MRIITKCKVLYARVHRLFFSSKTNNKRWDFSHQMSKNPVYYSEILQNRTFLYWCMTWNFRHKLSKNPIYYSDHFHKMYFFMIVTVFFFIFFLKRKNKWSKFLTEIEKKRQFSQNVTFYIVFFWLFVDKKNKGNIFDINWAKISYTTPKHYKM